MGTYLHQDYDLVGSIDDNVDVFVANSPDLAQRLPSEALTVLKTFGDDEIGNYLLSLGCQLRPRENDGGWRGWLAHIAERTQTALEPS